MAASGGGSDEFTIDDPLIWKDDEAAMVMVGKILSEKEVSKTTIETVVKKAWNLHNGLDVTAVAKNAFLFKFSEEDEYNRILRGRPWSINGQMLNLIERRKFMAIDECDFSKCPIWIQMHGMPLEATNLTNVICIARRIGEVAMAEDLNYNNRMIRSYMRVRVILDLRKPLVTGFWIPKPDKDRTWLSIKYEKLQDFCYKCGSIGHDFCTCVHQRLMAIANPEMPRYGNWTTTEQVRTWEEALVIVKEGWKEVNAKWKRQREEGKMRKEVDHININDIFAINMSEKSSKKKEAVEQELGGSLNEKKRYEVCNDSAESGSVNVLLEPIRPNDHEIGLSSFNISVEESSAHGEASQVQSSEGICEFKVDLPSDEDTDKKALVLYVKKGLCDVTKELGNLKLKRDAEKSLESELQKKRKVDGEGSNQQNVVTAFAENLRKLKAKARRDALRRERMVATNTGSVVGGSKRGRKKVNVEGMGGWPQTAPMES